MGTKWLNSHKVPTTVSDIQNGLNKRLIILNNNQSTVIDYVVDSRFQPYTVNSPESKPTIQANSFCS